jgi:hypothetical protein
MSNMINSKSRFGYNPDSDLVYDYITQKDVKPVASYVSKDGTWNLLEVKRLIMGGFYIDSARIGAVVKPAAAAPVAGAKQAVPVPGATPNSLPTTVSQVRVPASPAPTTVKPAPGPSAKPPLSPAPGLAPSGLSVAQLQALKLTAVQAAALSLTPTQMTATGVSPAQVKAWGLTPARADALALTPAQRAVLMP